MSEEGKRIATTEEELKKRNEDEAVRYYQKVDDEMKINWESEEQKERFYQSILEQRKLAETEAKLYLPNASGIQYQPNPREYLHQFLLSALHAGCHVENYIIDEINTMLAELKR